MTSGAGQVEVRSYRVVQDVGRALNPREIHGEIQGGGVQGLGYALHERPEVLRPPRSGRALSRRLRRSAPARRWV
nr:molybdopterin cofactor-binding domain-containing protein [Bradyrhizobium cosmicum]